MYSFVLAELGFVPTHASTRDVRIAAERDAAPEPRSAGPPQPAE
jgi:hypothetical protein